MSSTYIYVAAGAAAVAFAVFVITMLLTNSDNNKPPVVNTTDYEILDTFKVDNRYFY